MTATIVFEELGAAPALEVSCYGVIPLSIHAFAAIPEAGLFGYGELPLTFEAPGFTLEPAVIVSVYGELPLVAGPSFIPHVVGTEMEGEIPLYMLATTDRLLGRGSIPLRLSAMSIVGVPLDDNPVVELEEWVVGADSLAFDQITSAVVRLTGADTTAATANRMASAAETLTLRDRLRLLLEAVVTDSAAFSAVVTGNPVITAALVDTLVLAGVAENTIAAMATLSDLVALSEAVASVQEAEANDAAALADTLEALARALEVVVSTAVFSETLQGLAVLTVLMPDTVVLADTADGLAIYQAIIDERLALSVAFDFDGVPYVGLAMNTANRAVTEYDAFDYNSLASFGGRLYGAGAAGLYRLEGDTDAGQPIQAFVRTAMQRVAGGSAARISDAYLGFRASGALQLKVIVNDNAGQKVGHVYDLVAAPRGASQPGKFDVGRGLKSVYMAFELGNVAGADFAIDVLEIRPLILDRRLP